MFFPGHPKGFAGKCSITIGLTSAQDKSQGAAEETNEHDDDLVERVDTKLWLKEGFPLKISHQPTQ